MTGPRFGELLRVSSNSQDERDTPEIQRHDFDRMRRTSPGVFVQRWEETVSGAVRLDETECGLDIIARAKSGALDELRVWDIDRAFGIRADRLGDQAVLYDLAFECGMVIRDTKGTVIDPQSDDGKLIYSIRAVMASEERKKIARRTLGGKAKAARQNRLPCGQAPYGRRFDKVTGAWSIDTDEQDVVERIVKAIIGGTSVPDVCRVLNAEQIPSPTGKRWRPATIRKMIQLDHLVGTMVHQQKDQPSITYQIPTLITQPELDACRAALARRSPSRPPRKRGLRALCQERIFCSACEASGKRQSVHVRLKNGRYVYVCGSTHTDNHEKGENLHEDAWKSHVAEDLDGAVWDAICDAITKPEALRGAVLSEDNAGHWQEQADRCQELLDRQTKDRQALLRKRRRRLITEADEEAQLREMASERKTLVASLELAQQHLAALETERVRGDQLADQMAHLVQQIETTTSLKDRRAIFETLIPAERGYGVYLSPDGYLEIRGGISARQAAVPKANETTGALANTVS